MTGSSPSQGAPPDIFTKAERSALEDSNFFDQNGYLIIRGALSREFCAVVTDYARLRASLDQGKRDKHVPGAYSFYADPLIETLEASLWPRLESWISESLWPTYSYLRVYQTGDVLEPHTDRPSCEVSVSLCLGFDVGSQGREYRWPLLLNPLSKEPSGAPERVVSCLMDPGDIVMYLGPAVRHWRTNFEGEWQVQAFLHYVRRDAPNAALLKFDGRSALGMPLTNRDEVMAQRKQVEELMAKFRARKSS
jgi:hypothetical protein